MSRKSKSPVSSEEPSTVENGKPTESTMPSIRMDFHSLLIGIGIGLVVLAAILHLMPREAISTARFTPAVTNADTSPLKPFKVVNAHEHLFSCKHLPKYMEAASKTGIVRTLFLASSEYTLMGAGHDAQKGNDENTQEMLKAADAVSGMVVPMCTIHPADPEKLDKLKRFVVAGARGLKLYTGHSNFHDRPLDVEDMMPVYAYCEETGLPICWHINLSDYGDEFERVMQRFPKLKVIIPHFGVLFFRVTLEPLQQLFDKYPNLYTDTSFGTREILVSGLDAVSRAPERFRDFCVKNRERVLFGTDMVVTGNREKTEEWIEAVLRVCRNVLEKKVYTFPMAAKDGPYPSKLEGNSTGTFNGMGLDDDTLRMIYETNFEKLFPSSKQP